MAMPLRVQTGARTHEGQVRDHNEDSLFESDEIGLWAVADGMGGHEKGEWASAVLVEQLQSVELPGDFEDSCTRIAEAIHGANGIIYRESVARGHQMGSTVVVLHVADSRFAVFWVGDSRVYLLRNGMLVQLSRDHTQVQALVDAGLLQPEEANQHPMSHVLARAVGVGETLELDVVQDEVEPGDLFLLCSDGLHGYLRDEEIAGALASAPPVQSTQQLVDLTLERGAPDNVTAVAVMFTEPTLLSIGQMITAT